MHVRGKKFPIFAWYRVNQTSAVDVAVASYHEVANQPDYCVGKINSNIGVRLITRINFTLIVIP